MDKHVGILCSFDIAIFGQLLVCVSRRGVTASEMSELFVDGAVCDSASFVADAALPPVLHRLRLQQGATHLPSAFRGLPFLHADERLWVRHSASVVGEKERDEWQVAVLADTVEGAEARDVVYPSDASGVYRCDEDG